MEKKSKAKRVLLMSEEYIEAMTDDVLITLVKHEKRGTTHASRIWKLAGKR